MGPRMGFYSTGGNNSIGLQQCGQCVQSTVLTHAAGTLFFYRTLLLAIVVDTSFGQKRGSTSEIKGFTKGGVWEERQQCIPDSTPSKAKNELFLLFCFLHSKTEGFRHDH